MSVPSPGLAKTYSTITVPPSSEAMMTPTIVSAGIVAFGSRWRNTTWRRSRPLSRRRPDVGRGPDVVERRAQDPQHRRGDMDRERDRGQQHDLEALERMVLERDVALRRQPLQLHAEDDDQEDSADERRCRHATGREGGERRVEPALAPDRGDRRRGYSDQQTEDQRDDASSSVEPDQMRSVISVVTGNWL